MHHVFSIDTALPTAPFPWSITSFQLFSLHISSDLRTEKDLSDQGNWHRIAKDIVDRAQTVAVHAVQLCSRKPLVQRCHLLSIQHLKHAVCKSSVPHPESRFPTTVPRFLKYSHSCGFIVALKTLQMLNFCLNFVMHLLFLPCHYSYSKVEEPGEKKSLSHFPPRPSQYLLSKSPRVFQSLSKYSKPSWDELNIEWDS